MREFTKSVMSCSWAMSLFGVQQVMNLLTPGGKPSTAFSNVTAAAAEELDPSLRAAFQMGEKVQNEMMGMAIGNFDLDPCRWVKMTADAARGSGNCAGASPFQSPSQPQSTPPGNSPPSSSAGDPQKSDPKPGWGPMAR